MDHASNGALTSASFSNDQHRILVCTEGVYKLIYALHGGGYANEATHAHSYVRLITDSHI